MHAKAHTGLLLYHSTNCSGGLFVCLFVKLAGFYFSLYLA